MTDQNSDLKMTWTHTFKEAMSDTVNAIAALIISTIAVTLQLIGLINLPTLVINFLYALIFISAIRVLGQLIRDCVKKRAARKEKEKKIAQDIKVSNEIKLKRESAIHKLNVVQLYWIQSLRYTTYVNCSTDYEDLTELENLGFIKQRETFKSRVIIEEHTKLFLDNIWNQWDDICLKAINLFYKNMSHKGMHNYISKFSDPKITYIDISDYARCPFANFLYSNRHSILFDVSKNTYHNELKVSELARKAAIDYLKE